MIGTSWFQNVNEKLRTLLYIIMLSSAVWTVVSVDINKLVYI